MIPGDLAAALAIVGEARPDDAPPVAARRTTCRELAALATEVQTARKDAGIVDFPDSPKNVVRSNPRAPHGLERSLCPRARLAQRRQPRVVRVSATGPSKVSRAKSHAHMRRPSTVGRP